MSHPVLLLSLPASARALAAVRSIALAPVDLPAVVQSIDTSEHDGGVESGNPTRSEEWMMMMMTYRERRGRKRSETRSIDLPPQVLPRF